MSVKLMTLVWRNGPPKAVDRTVLLAIADHANDEDRAWPSVELLARKTCYNVRTVQRSLRRLEEAGWLTVERRGGMDAQRRGTPNLYRVERARLAIPAPSHPSPTAPARTRPPTESAPNLAESPEYPGSLPPEPSENQHGTPSNHYGFAVADPVSDSLEFPLAGPRRARAEPEHGASTRTPLDEFVSEYESSGDTRGREQSEQRARTKSEQEIKRNRYDGACAKCGAYVGAGEGRLSGRVPVHLTCPRDLDAVGTDDSRWSDLDALDIASGLEAHGVRKRA